MDYDYFDNVIDYDYDYDYIDFSLNVIDYDIVIVIMSTITITPCLLPGAPLPLTLSLNLPPKLLHAHYTFLPSQLLPPKYMAPSLILSKLLIYCSTLSGKKLY